MASVAARLVRRLALPPDLRIRRARPSDDAFRADLYRATREGERFAAGLSAPAFEAFVESQFRLREEHVARTSSSAAVFLIETSAPPTGPATRRMSPAPVGGLTLDVRPLSPPSPMDGRLALRIIDIALVPAAQGRGYGGHIVEALVGAARSEGLAAVDLSVRIDNPGAFDFWTRHGFALVEGDGPASHRPLRRTL